MRFMNSDDNLFYTCSLIEYIGRITKSEIMAQCPDISQVTVQRALAELIERVLNDPENADIIAAVRSEVNGIMKDYPLFAY